MTSRAPIVIPPALMLLGLQERWVIWRWVTGKNGKPTKPPFRANEPSRHASSTDPTTWSSFDVALHAYVEGHCDGIGFALHGSGAVALDIDHCRDASTGEIHPWAQDLVRRCGSYAEVTPSGEGIRIIGLGHGLLVHRKFNVPEADGVSVEIYRNAERYITVTGIAIDDTIKQLADIDAQADALLSDLDGAKQEKPRTDGADNKTAGHKHDLDSLIRDGCGTDFGGDRSRAVWFVINALLKQEKTVDEIVALLLDRGNGISAHIYDQSRPEEYARKQVEKAQKEQAEDPDLEITRLAKLTALQYEKERKAAADKLEVRASILDKLVQAERDKLGLDPDDGKQGHAISFPEPEPWPEPVDGAALLDGIAVAIRDHVVMSDATRDEAALWVLHAHMIDCFLVSPRLAVTSPVKGCGKTTLLDVLSRLVPRPLPTANVTPAALFRVVEGYQPTLLVDEADTFLHDNDELRGVLNSGHRKGGTVLRTVGDDHEPRAFATYAACAIALIGSLPDTLHDRAVTIDLKRRLRTETVAPFRPDRADRLDVLIRKAARWAKDHADRIAERDPEMPDGIINREADNWRPLIAIAEEAGGEWSDRARKAAAAAHIAAAGDEASRLEVLLGDIRVIFTEQGKDEIPSADLVRGLVGLEGRPWAELGRNRKPLTTNGLARRLKPLASIPENIRIGDKVPKGYKLAHFEDAFVRYLGPEGASEPLRRYSTDEMGTSEPFQTATDQPDVADWKCEKSANNGPRSGVADEKGDSGEKTHVRAARPKSDDLPYRGPVVEVPDLPPDPLDEHGVPQPASRGNGDEPGLSRRRIQELGDWYQNESHQRHCEDRLDTAELDTELRMILREEVAFPEHVEIEFERVMQVVVAV
jgi:hypothetical protein